MTINKNKNNIIAKFYSPSQDLLKMKKIHKFKFIEIKFNLNKYS